MIFQSFSEAVPRGTGDLFCILKNDQQAKEEETHEAVAKKDKSLKWSTQLPQN